MNYRVIRDFRRSRLTLLRSYALDIDGIRFDVDVRNCVDPHRASFGVSAEVRNSARQAALVSAKEYYVSGAVGRA